MRERLLDTPARVRMSQAMLTAAKARARKEGVSLSEFMRGALRRELRATPKRRAG